MSGKHDCECGCVECIAYMETNLQVDLDEWSYDVDFPGTVPSIRYSVGTATNRLTADTDRRLVDKNAVVLNPHSFGSVNPPDIRENVSVTQRENQKERRAEQQRKRRALERANHETILQRKGLEQRRIKSAQQKRLKRAQVRGLGSWVLGLGSWVLGPDMMRH